MHARQSVGQVFQVLGINVLPTDDDQVFLAPDDEDLFPASIPKVARQVPAGVESLLGQVIPAVIAGQHAV